MRVLGVNVASGHLYFAALDPATASTLQLGAPVNAGLHIRPSEGLGAAHQVVDIRDRFKQDLRELEAKHVGLVATRRHAGLAYRNAYKRITVVSAVMIACVELDIPYEEVQTESISRVVKVPAHQLQRAPYEAYGFTDTPTYWSSGLAEAFGSAAYLLTRTLDRD